MVNEKRSRTFWELTRLRLTIFRLLFDMDLICLLVSSKSQYQICYEIWISHGTWIRQILAQIYDDVNVHSIYAYGI